MRDVLHQVRNQLNGQHDTLEDIISGVRTSVWHKVSNEMRYPVSLMCWHLTALHVHEQLDEEHVL